MKTKPSISNVVTKPAGNADDPAYDTFLATFHRFTETGELLFTTKADPKQLWQTYLTSFPVSERQHYNCNACRHFIERYGGLVTINRANGTLTPALWKHWEECDAPYRKAVKRLFDVVKAEPVAQGLFVSSELVLGHPQTGPWRHLSFRNPYPWVTNHVQTAEQRVAEVNQNALQVRTALCEWHPSTFVKAEAFIKADGMLFRSEKIEGPFTWLKALKDTIPIGGLTTPGWNQLLFEVAKAPNGFCHPRSSVLGTLMDDIQNGVPLPDIRKKFADKMDPTQYRRPQAAPTAQTVDQANKLFTNLGLSRSLQRRFTSVEEIKLALARYPDGQRLTWFPPHHVPRTKRTATGPFSTSLATQSVKPSFGETNMGNITWVKFQRDVLDAGEAQEIFANVTPRTTSFYTITTCDLDAPPILQWDQEDRRNPFAWYTYVGGRLCYHYRMMVGYARVMGIVPRPCHWYGKTMPNYSQAALLLLRGASDTENNSLCLFPETLKSEFHGIRSVIEAHSRAKKLTGVDSATGLMIEQNAKQPITLRVNTRSLGTLVYTIDRWE